MKNTRNKEVTSIEETILENNDKNFFNTQRFIHQQNKILKSKLANCQLDPHDSFDSIRNVVIDPSSMPRQELASSKREKIDFETYKQKIEPAKLLPNIESKKRKIIPGIEKSFKKAKSRPVIKLNNYYVGQNVLEKQFAALLKQKNVKKVLILSDTAYSRNLNVYKKAVSVLQDNGIEFVEFTNIQPRLERDLIFKMSDFAFKHGVNCLLTIGSQSTIDVSKLLLVKLLKPNLIRLHKNNSTPVICPHFSTFTIPTFVVPDDKVNSRSSLDNTIWFKKYDYYGTTIFLSAPIDSSDAVFYVTDVFKDLSQSKIIEILHETFFRLILNFYDEKSLAEERSALIKNIRIINWYTQYASSKHCINDEDQKIIIEIIASTVDGRHFIDNGLLWTWYKLESSLSYLLNSKKSLGLALFLPSFLEFASLEDEDFKARSIELSKKLFNCISVEGLIFNLIKYIEKYSLPLKLLDIPEIEKVDYKFLSYIVRKSSNYISSFKITKTIIKNLSVW